MHKMEYKLAEDIFDPKYAALSQSEQLRKTCEKMQQAGVMSEEESKKFMKTVIEEQKELEKESFIDMFTQMLTKTSKEDICDDGDQSPLKGNASQKLRNQWSSGMDFHPDNLSYFHKLCFDANLPLVKKALKDCADKRKLMEKRETLMTFNAMICVVQGARLVQPSVGKSENKYCDVLKVLIAEGGNIHAKDVAGYSVLYHCVTAFGNIKETLKLAKILIEAGADPNTQNRFGCTPLHENIMIRRYYVLDFLIENGADPSVQDNDGVSPNSMAKLLPEGQKLFSKAGFLIGDKKRQEAKSSGQLGKCYQCGKKDAKKRCCRCLVAYYCNRNCQLQHWKKHKKDCSEKKKGKIDVELKGPGVATTINFKKENCTMTTGKDAPQKTTFKVKVQVPLSFREDDSPLLVYDKKKTFQKWIESSNPNYGKIVKKIKEEGVMKAKGYFYASLNENGSISLQVDHMLPPESW